MAFSAIYPIRSNHDDAGERVIEPSISGATGGRAEAEATAAVGHARGPALPGGLAGGL